MIVILSPAKKLDLETKIDPQLKHTKPIFLDQSEELIEVLKKKSVKEISKLMNLSQNLSQLNYDRFQNWDKEHTSVFARQNVLTFNGAAYLGLDATSLSEEDLIYSQKKLRILSGLYGILKPLDMILPYRLEMGTKLPTNNGSNLYHFWGNEISKSLEKELKEEENIIVNLASNEYSKVLNLKKMEARVINCHFKDMSKTGEYKTIMTYAKTARGLMTRFIIKNKIKNPSYLVGFDYKGYLYNEAMSSENELTFIRG